ncbi:S4 domain-containing protein YaaA [Levilactobacillus cerevisiae]|uniref:S4 domain-containing protein YaaA n=1 Tax=Levilactobacillus cerevisiae TaxID=1704076 RepID=UPI000F781D79|nr:S4 domain-containing protein YaaA [Levilactobacillus cerevisiae]
MKKEVFIDTPYITLGQMLKEESVISTGGQAKWYLRENTVNVNDEPDNRRGRKLYPNDTVDVPETGSFVIRSKQGE